MAASTSCHATRRGDATFFWCGSHGRRPTGTVGLVWFGLGWVAFGAVAPSGSSAHMFEAQSPADEATRRDETTLEVWLWARRVMQRGQ
jgi:hypothetical protein